MVSVSFLVAGGRFELRFCAERVLVVGCTSAKPKKWLSPFQKFSFQVHDENEKGHPCGCPFSFWLREEDSNFGFAPSRCLSWAVPAQNLRNGCRHFRSPHSKHTATKNKAHQTVCLAFLWLREEDSNFRPYLCGARNAYARCSLRRISTAAEADLLPVSAAGGGRRRHRLFAQGLITLGRSTN